MNQSLAVTISRDDSLSIDAQQEVRVTGQLSMKMKEFGDCIIIALSLAMIFVPILEWSAFYSYTLFLTTQCNNDFSLMNSNSLIVFLFHSQ